MICVLSLIDWFNLCRLKGSIPIELLLEAMAHWSYWFCDKGEQGHTLPVWCEPQRFKISPFFFALDLPISPWHHGIWEVDICSQKHFGKPSDSKNTSGIHQIWETTHLKSMSLEEILIWPLFTFGFPSDLQWSQSARNCSSKRWWLQYGGHLRGPCHSPQSTW